MPTSQQVNKVECLNPNTGGRMHIDTTTYALFSKAIYQCLRGGKQLTYTQLVKGVQEYFQKQSTSFDGSVEWYTVTVKNDMEARGIIESFTRKGKKLNAIKKEELL